MVATENAEYLLQVEPAINPASYGIISPHKIYRYDRGDDRYYYTNPENKGAMGYLSVTSFTKKSLATSPHLIDWMIGMGKEAAEFYKNERAAYGTFLHCEIVECIIKGGGDFSDISNRAFVSAVNDGYGYNAATWSSDVVNDIASFFSFVKDRNVKFIAAEFPVFSERYRLAGCIDLVCKLEFNRKEVNALIDIKSGRKGFTESHELQLHCYKEIWNETFESKFPVTHVFNWAPKNVTAKTKYDLKNQTESIYAGTVKQRMEMAKLEGWIKPPTQHMEIIGAFSVNSFNLTDHLLFQNI